MILLVDNYDSFTYNLAHLFGELGAEVTVVRNDEIDADGAERLAPSHLVVARAGRNVESGWHPRHRERVVAAGFERVGQSREDPPAVVPDEA